MEYMFYNSSKLTTIYASDSWSTANVKYSGNMFGQCTSLVGKRAYSSYEIDVDMANWTTGYLTYKAV